MLCRYVGSPTYLHSIPVFCFIRCSGVLTVEFPSAAYVKGFGLWFPPMQRRSFVTKKKEVFYPPFMVGFTVKVLICIDMFLKCCAKLKLNTWVRPSGFKEPAKGQRHETGQQTDLTICSLHNLANAQMRSTCTFFPHEAHVFSGGWYLLMHSGATTGMEGNSFLASTECWEDVHINLHFCQHF